MPPTQTQAIHYTNIPRSLQLDYGLCISLVMQRNYVKIRHLVITMVKYVFCCSTFNSYTKKTCQPHKNKPFGYSNIPSYLQWALLLSISWFVHKNYVKIRQLVITIASEWAIMWRRNYFLHKNCPTYYICFLCYYVRFWHKQRIKLT